MSRPRYAARGQTASEKIARELALLRARQAWLSDRVTALQRRVDQLEAERPNRLGPQPVGWPIPEGPTCSLFNPPAGTVGTGTNLHFKT